MEPPPKEPPPNEMPPNEMPVRLGPRPLPFHLLAAQSTWLISRAVLSASKRESLPWRPELETTGRALEAQLGAYPATAVEAAVDAEIARRTAALLTGIQRYRRHPYRRRLTDPPAVWQCGAARLLDFGATRAEPGAVPLLLVPSLINRAYILDLMPGLSLVRWLADRGIRPYLVDWGRPGVPERGYDLDDYITVVLEGALEQVLSRASARPYLLGYCMGGLLALALALRREADLAGLALLATPWNFHADGQAALAGRLMAAMMPAVEAAGELPVDLIQLLFAALDPQMVLRKFLAFATLDPASPRAEPFVALEDWLNDGVPLMPAVARECLIGWYGENRPAGRSWRVAGSTVDPARLGLPNLVMIPGRDRIVPPDSAAALAEALPGAQVLRPPVGHIGMIVSARARLAVWGPLLAWLAGSARQIF